MHSLASDKSTNPTDSQTQSLSRTQSQTILQAQLGADVSSDLKVAALSEEEEEESGQDVFGDKVAAVFPFIKMLQLQVSVFNL